MNKAMLKKVIIGLIVGIIVGFIIRYLREVAIAPFICGVAGALVAATNYKRKNKKG